MEPKHPAEGKFWWPLIGVLLLGFVFFAAITDGRVSSILAQIFFGLFVVAVAGAVFAEILLHHGYWVEARQRKEEGYRRTREQ